MLEKMLSSTWAKTKNLALHRDLLVVIFFHLFRANLTQDKTVLLFFCYLSIHQNSPWWMLFSWLVIILWILWLYGLKGFLMWRALNTDPQIPSHILWPLHHALLLWNKDKIEKYVVTSSSIVSKLPPGFSHHAHLQAVGAPSYATAWWGRC